MCDYRLGFGRGGTGISMPDSKRAFLQGGFGKKKKTSTGQGLKCFSLRCLIRSYSRTHVAKVDPEKSTNNAVNREAALHVVNRARQRSDDVIEGESICVTMLLNWNLGFFFPTHGTTGKDPDLVTNRLFELSHWASQAN